MVVAFLFAFSMQALQRKNRNKATVIEMFIQSRCKKQEIISASILSNYMHLQKLCTQRLLIGTPCLHILYLAPTCQNGCMHRSKAKLLLGRFQGMPTHRGWDQTVKAVPIAVGSASIILFF